MTNLKPLTVLILTMGILFGCDDKSQKGKNIKVTKLDTISFEDLSRKVYA